MKAIKRFAILTIVALLTGCSTTTNNVKRYGSVIGVKEETLEYYKKLHAEPWQGVLNNLKACNIHNYSIYLKKMGSST